MLATGCRITLVFVWIAMLGAGCSAEKRETASETLEASPPNIIFILADDLGYGDLGVYGQSQIQTPEIDRLAAEGMRFTQFYAGSTVCAPSRSVLMTGLHTGRTPIRGNREVAPMGQQPLPAHTVTVAEMLKDAGYTTGLIGKWGLGGPGTEGTPGNQGFDYFFGYLGQRHAHNYYPEFLFRNDERIPLAGNRIENPRPDGAGHAVERVQYSHDLLAAEALEFIERNQSEPFFLYLALTIPHANNEAGDQGMEAPDYGIYAEKDWPDSEKGFAAMISRMDGDVGRIVQKLKDLGIDDQTVVFFTSDNGPHKEGGHDPAFFDSNGPLRGIKRDLYEGGIRVPMIVRWPDRIPEAAVSDHVGYFGDFMATAAELAGIMPPDSLDGTSFLPALLGQAEAQRASPYLYWEFYEGGSAQAARLGRWKGIRKPMFTGEMELYDLLDDPGEEHNLADRQTELVSQIQSVMEKAHVPDSLWQIK